jgi:hypothetical protein
MHYARILTRRDMRRFVEPARKQEVGRRQHCRLNPCPDTVAGLLCDLELDRPLSFLLHDRRSAGDSVPVANVANPQLRQIARAQFAVDCQIEHREIANSRRKLEADPNGPDFPELQRRLLPRQLALVPRYPRGDSFVNRFHDVLLSSEGRTSLSHLSAGAVRPVAVIRLIKARRLLTGYQRPGLLVLTERWLSTRATPVTRRQIDLNVVALD